MNSKRCNNSDDDDNLLGNACYPENHCMFSQNVHAPYIKKINARSLLINVAKCVVESK